MIILGGKSDEYPVSLHSAGSLIHKTDKEHYELIFIGISKDGKWCAHDGDVNGTGHDTWLCEEHCASCVLSSSEGYRGFLKLHTDGASTHIGVSCIFLILHGKNGGDGATQGLFELSGIPYVGCGYMSSVTYMNKEVAHIVMEHAGISRAPLVCVYKADGLDYRKVHKHTKGTLGLPVFIKSANARSSFGIHRMESFDGFEEAMKDAFYHDGKGKVILGTTIEGFEVRVAVTGDKGLFAGSVDEIETTAPFFDHEGKYEMVDSRIYYPARISPKLFEEARKATKKARRATSCKEMIRVDMFVTPEDTTILNEVNTIPGLTDTFRHPIMMKEADIPSPELIGKLVTLTMEE